MKARLLRALGPLLGLCLFGVALWVLHRELRTIHIHQIAAAVHGIPAGKFILAIFLTAAGYTVMTGYDALTLKYIKRPLEYGKIAFASFISYAFSNNIGLAMIAGGSVRFRLYSAWGLSILEITQVLAFVTLTLWLGFLLLSGAAFLAEPGLLSAVTPMPALGVRAVGALFVLVVLGYFLATAFYRKPITIKGREITLPDVKISAAQILIAVCDWTLAGSVLFALLPNSAKIGWFGFMGAFLVAQLAGLSSQVPGGLGVFESVLLAMLSGRVAGPELLGSLVVFRAVYYLFPLAVAAGLLGGQEALRKRADLKKAARFIVRWQTLLVPNVLAFTVFAAGAILLFSGATPAYPQRLEWLTDFLPLPVIEISHFLGSLTGALLILLARSLERRVDGAYFLTVGLLCGGMVFSLLKGLDYEEAAFISVMLLALAPCRKYFHRRASLLGERFTFQWVALIFLVLLAAAWLTFFSYKHVEYRQELWWRFAFSAQAPRSLRALAGACIVSLIFGMLHLLRPTAPKMPFSGPELVEKAAKIAERSQDTETGLVYLGDKLILMNQEETAFIMYGIEGRSWVALGDPIGPAADLPALAWKFLDAADAAGAWPVFYEVSASNLPLYIDLGLNLLKMGEQARVPLGNFSLDGRSRKNMRHEVNRIEKEGYHFEIAPASEVPGLLPRLREISDAWLALKRTREKGFSLGFFNEDYMKRFPVALVKRGDEIAAFANIWQGAEKAGLSVDLMRYAPGGPGGLMDYLFIKLMLWGKEEGFGYFNLGMAPLSGFTDRRQASLWNRLGAILYKYGDQFYNFRGLRRFKEKFDPVWEPCYLALPGSLKVPLVLTNIAALVSGGMKGVVGK